ncbi:uncharacterized protein BJ212DRAFT_1334112 [Suillus subaureus]|uniref:Uncharacterized protein n=1 Tax=Suillus subaureus TaxID=48587 RepID=A0A9P7EIF1_9AGAM|nr:uncharacterized protein BJ212DRAFT_1334112 [Suillus subaureus]KAG1821852.1 hypothetical protein BJ212DRAFT_1334112 [Suillus subaureus]
MGAWARYRSACALGLLNLLTEHPLQGHVERLYRHDLELFIRIYAWVCLLIVGISHRP